MSASTRDGVKAEPTAAKELRLCVAASPRHLHEIRRAVTVWARAAGLNDDRVQDLCVAVTEACSNAIRHAYPEGGGEIRIEGRAEDAGLLVAVADDGAGLSEAPDAVGMGLGLPLMGALADEVGVHQPPAGGLEVRLRFARP